MIEEKKIIAIIPARGGSKGVKHKNLRHYKNHSLLAHTILTAKASRYIDSIIVSSEDDEIIAEAKKFGANVPFPRPKELAEDTSPMIDCVLYTLDKITKYDYVILLQPTSPLRTTDDIDECILHCLNHHANSCASVTKANKHPFWMYIMNDTQQLMPLFTGEIPTRRQDLPDVYLANGAIYIATPDWLRKNKKFITQETLAYVMSETKSLDIDTEFDLMLLNNISDKCTT